MYIYTLYAYIYLDNNMKIERIMCYMKSNPEPHTYEPRMSQILITLCSHLIQMSFSCINVYILDLTNAFFKHYIIYRKRL